MFERYTDSARRSLFFARYDASQLGSLSIEPEHLLLALLRDSRGMSALAPVSLEGLRQEIAKTVAFSEKLPTSVEIPFSEAAKRVLQFAAEEAEVLRHAHIGTEHLLLGVLREERSAAAAALAARGLRLSDARQRVEQLSEPLDGPSLDTLLDDEGLR